jgi:hypothetical protein
MSLFVSILLSYYLSQFHTHLLPTLFQLHCSKLANTGNQRSTTYKLQLANKQPNKINKIPS